VVDKKTNLLDLDRIALQGFFTEIGEKPFRALQVLKWIHQQRVTDFDEMLNLSKALRAKLKEIACIEAPEVVLDNVSNDGTRKWLMQLSCGNNIETVYIPEAERGTLCISSQIGCALNCSFCSTGKMGFNRNLTVSEIIGQLWMANQKLIEAGSDVLVTNVVMMGMGEPLLNFDPVVSAMSLMMDDLAYGLSKRRVTLSTSGVVPAMYKLAEVSDCALAVSLHAPNDEIREKLVPLNKKYPLKELLLACKEFFKDKGKRDVTFEYVMLDGINDSMANARELAKVIADIPCKVNLIPFNAIPNTDYRSSSKETIDKFRDILMRAGIMTVTRKTRGDDIDAACGQLVGEFKDRTSRRERLENITLPVYSDYQGEQVQNA